METRCETSLPNRRGEQSIHYSLRESLLEGYHKDIRPVRFPSDQLNITVRAHMYQIISVNAASNTIKLTAGVEMKWIDAYLRWNPSSFSDVQRIHLPANTVWTPELTVYYSVDSETMSVPHEYLEVDVQHDGHVTFFVSFTVHSLCPFNVKKFPYDNQTCYLLFGSLAHTIDTMDVTPIHEVEMNEFYDNQEWELDKVAFYKEYRNTSGRSHPYGVLVLKLAIHRQPFYYVFILVIPGVLITLVAIAGFHCPTTSRPVREAKFHMGLLTLLSMSVLLVGVADTLPKFATTSIPGKRGSFSGVPLLGIYYLSLLIMIMLASITTSLLVIIELWASDNHSEGHLDRVTGSVKRSQSNDAGSGHNWSTNIYSRLHSRFPRLSGRYIFKHRDHNSASSNEPKQEEYIIAAPIERPPPSQSISISTVARSNIDALESQLTFTCEILSEVKEILQSIAAKQSAHRQISKMVNRMQLVSLVFYLATLGVLLLMFFYHDWWYGD